MCLYHRKAEECFGTVAGLQCTMHLTWDMQGTSLNIFMVLNKILLNFYVELRKFFCEKEYL